MTTNNNSKKSKKHLIKDKKVKNVKKSRAKRNHIIKRNTSSLSNLYTYESPVTNKEGSMNKSNSILNVNIINGLKDYLAIKK